MPNNNDAKPHNTINEKNLDTFFEKIKINNYEKKWIMRLNSDTGETILIC